MRSRATGSRNPIHPCRFNPRRTYLVQMFGNAGREHMKLYGTKPEHFAKIAEKNHRHSVENPKSQFRDEYSLQQVLL